ncbi:hypothetical protein [Alloprevotella tannerae]|uniref:hypothetical protein n=1 Tax=Alloprevotella tannerae TaxID=76122 RepID=UPI0028EE03B4|nr:hypothetical protein [Alloprevotella tannerae]
MVIVANLGVSSARTSFTAFFLPSAGGAVDLYFPKILLYRTTAGFRERPVKLGCTIQEHPSLGKGTKNGKRNFRCQLPAILIPPDTWERNACGTFSF